MFFAGIIHTDSKRLGVKLTLLMLTLLIYINACSDDKNIISVAKGSIVTDNDKNICMLHPLVVDITKSKKIYNSQPFWCISNRFGFGKRDGVYTIFTETRYTPLPDKSIVSGYWGSIFQTIPTTPKKIKLPRSFLDLWAGFGNFIIDNATDYDIQVTCILKNKMLKFIIPKRSHILDYIPPGVYFFSFNKLDQTILEKCYLSISAEYNLYIYNINNKNNYEILMGFYRPR